MPFSFNPLSLSHDALTLKGQLASLGIKEKTDESINFTQEEYSNIDMLNRVMEFVGYYMDECLSGNVKFIRRLNFYAITEAVIELDFAIQHALCGLYKAAYSSLRNALELVMLQIYMNSDSVSDEYAKQWMQSKQDTPHFSDMIKSCIIEDRFKLINNVCDWKKNIQTIYWGLCDYIHNRGMTKGYRSLSNSWGTYNTSYHAWVKKETLFNFYDDYIKTVGEIVVLLTVLNPFIIIGLPMQEKFGDDGPIGFFNMYQADFIKGMIPSTYKDVLINDIINDENMKVTIDWFSEQKDITKDEVERQLADYFERIIDMNKGNE